MLPSYGPTLIDHRRDGLGSGMRSEGDVNGRDAKEPPVGFVTTKVRLVDQSNNHISFLDTLRHATQTNSDRSKCGTYSSSIIE